MLKKYKNPSPIFYLRLYKQLWREIIKIANMNLVNEKVKNYYLTIAKKRVTKYWYTDYLIYLECGVNQTIIQ